MAWDILAGEVIYKYLNQLFVKVTEADVEGTKVIQSWEGANFIFFDLKSYLKTCFSDFFWLRGITFNSEGHRVEPTSLGLCFGGFPTQKPLDFADFQDNLLLG